MKDRLVIEIKYGSLMAVYTDRRDIEVVLVDHDEVEGIASAVIISDSIDDMQMAIRTLSDDAVRRLHSKSGERRE